MPVSQREIARHLNLSVATVSRSLVADSAISAATRARVVEAAAQMGYRAPGRKSARTAATAEAAEERDAVRLGVLLRCGSGADYGDQRVSLLEGMTVAAREAGVRLMIDTLLPDDDQRLRDEPERLPMLTGPAAPAGLLLWQALPPDALQRITSFRPCVLVNNHYLPGCRVDSVGPNHFDAIVGLVEHLHALGHRRIGYVGQLRQHVWGAQRVGAFVAGLYKCGLPDEPALRVDIDEAEMEERMLRLTRGGVTAWVGASEGSTHRAFRVLSEAGISVPGDVSLTGYHVHVPGPMPMKVTTMVAPWRDIGRHAVRRLLDRLNNRAEPGRRVMLDCAFIDGASSASPSSI